MCAACPCLCLTVTLTVWCLTDDLFVHWPWLWLCLWSVQRRSLWPGPPARFTCVVQSCSGRGPGSAVSSYGTPCCGGGAALPRGCAGGSQRPAAVPSLGLWPARTLGVGLGSRPCPTLGAGAGTGLRAAASWFCCVRSLETPGPEACPWLSPVSPGPREAVWREGEQHGRPESLGCLRKQEALH